MVKHLKIFANIKVLTQDLIELRKPNNNGIQVSVYEFCKYQGFNLRPDGVKRTK